MLAIARLAKLLGESLAFGRRQDLGAVLPSVDWLKLDQGLESLGLPLWPVPVFVLPVKLA
jgi:hypothetical protein